MNLRLLTLAAWLSLAATANAGEPFEGNWARAGLAGILVRSLAMDPDDATILYAGTQQDGVLYTIDGGRTWLALSDGLPAGEAQTVSAVVLDPTDPSIVYAGTRAGVFRSEQLGPWVDLGVTRSDAVALPIVVDELSIAPDDGDAILVAGNANLMRSTDGTNFSEVPDVDAWTVRHSPHDPDVILAGRFSESFRSVTGGDTWTETALDDLIDRGSTSVFIGKYFFHPADPEKAYLATIQGGPRLSISDDEGVTYPTVSPFPGSQINTLVGDPLDANIIYASASSAFGGNGTWRSVDGAASWQLLVEAPYTERVFTSLALSNMALDDDRLYGAQLGDGVWVFSKERIFTHNFEAYD